VTLLQVGRSADRSNILLLPVLFCFVKKKNIHSESSSHKNKNFKQTNKQNKTKQNKTKQTNSK